MSFCNKYSIVVSEIISSNEVPFLNGKGDGDEDSAMVTVGAGEVVEEREQQIVIILEEPLSPLTHTTVTSQVSTTRVK